MMRTLTPGCHLDRRDLPAAADVYVRIDGGNQDFLGRGRVADDVDHEGVEIEFGGWLGLTKIAGETVEVEVRANVRSGPNPAFVFRGFRVALDGRTLSIGKPAGLGEVPA